MGKCWKGKEEEDKLTINYKYLHKVCWSGSAISSATVSLSFSSHSFLSGEMLEMFLRRKHQIEADCIVSDLTIHFQT